MGDVDTLLALGITPGMIAPWGAQDVPGITGVGPWAEDALGPARPEILSGTASGITSDASEKIAGVNPTRIVAVNHSIDGDTAQLLQSIAPTTLKPDGATNWQIPWRDQVKQIAAGVDRADEADSLISEAEESFDSFQKKHPETAG